MRRESLRRHGVLERVPKTRGLELFRDVRREDSRMKQDGEVVGESEGERGSRTRVESRLEGYKGRGKAVDRFREERPVVEPEAEDEGRKS